jgi:hypothetical protein
VGQAPPYIAVAVNIQAKRKTQKVPDTFNVSIDPVDQAACGVFVDRPGPLAQHYLGQDEGDGSDHDGIS